MWMPALYVSCVFNILSDQFCRLITNTRTSLLAEADHVIRGSRDQVFEALLECVQSVETSKHRCRPTCWHTCNLMFTLSIVAVDRTFSKSFTFEVAVDRTPQEQIRCKHSWLGRLQTPRDTDGRPEWHPGHCNVTVTRVDNCITITYRGPLHSLHSLRANVRNWRVSSIDWFTSVSAYGRSVTD